MKKVLVIVANSGLGHLKRVLAIMKQLPSNQYQWKVVVDKKKLEAFIDLPQAEYLHLDAGIEEYEASFLSKYPALLADADWVWSDNLTFVLKHHPKVFLTGSFLWADVLGGAEELALVKRFRPAMIGNRYLSTESVRQLTDFKPVGFLWYGAPRISAVKDAVLVSCGNTPAAQEYLRANLVSLYEEIARVCKPVLMEPSMMAGFTQMAHVQKASFKDEQWARTIACVIRPGMGTLTDAVVYGARIFAFNEGNNAEINHNTAMLELLGLGCRVNSPREGVRMAVDYIKDEKAQARHQEALAKIDVQGMGQVINEIQRILNK